jgi:CO/xanthine dehydrogenase Mo-binding subunit
MDLPPSKVRVKEIHSGGGFGSRGKVCEDQAIAAFLAQKSRRPVKITYSREEELTSTRIRIPFRIWIKQGVRKDGTLIARHVRAIADQGAYCQWAPAIVGYAGGVSCSLYRVPNVKYEGSIVYTNKHYGGPFRGFGSPQVTFAIESQMDLIAAKLSMDPVELRLRNANGSGETTACGWKITSCGFSECIRRAAEVTDWRAKKREKKVGNLVRGIGMGCSIHITASSTASEKDHSGSIIKMSEDGMVSIYKSSPDIGTWSNTAIAQIVAEELGIEINRINVVTMDTEITPIDVGSFASRVLFMNGNAARKAAQEMRKRLFRAVAENLEANIEDLKVRKGWVYIKGNPQIGMAYEDAVRRSDGKIGDCIIEEYEYIPPAELLNAETGYSNISAAYSFGAQVAEVEVSKETGAVSVISIASAQDVGRAINPLAIEGQLEGSVVQGIGFALTERYAYEEGQVLNADFRDYKVPTTKDIPQLDKIKTILVETVDEEGPFGAKGVGELGLNPTAAAIANAIYDATGIQMRDLPMTSEKIYLALEGMGGRGDEG